MGRSDSGLCMYQCNLNGMKLDAIRLATEHLPRPRSPHDRRMIAKFWRCYRGMLEFAGGELAYKAPLWRNARGDRYK